MKSSLDYGASMPICQFIGKGSIALIRPRAIESKGRTPQVL